jgi:hypothetical protein
MRTPLYGYPGAPLHLHLPNPKTEEEGTRAGNGLVEFPLTIYRKSRISFPVCGGAYLRFQPVRLVTSLLRKILAERPVVIYIHPRDFYPLDKIPDEINYISRIGLFHGVEKTLSKLEKLMDNFHFQPIREVLSL